MQTTSISTTKVVEKRSNTTSQPQKPAPQVVDKRTQKTTTVTTTKTVTPAKPVTQVQVVEKRSQKPGTTVKTTTTTTMVSNTRQPITTTTNTRQPITTTTVSNTRQPITTTTNTRPPITTTTTKTTTTTVSNTRQPINLASNKKPATQVQTSNKRSQNTTTVVKTSYSPSKPATQPKVDDKRTHKTVPVKVTTTQVKTVEHKNQRSTSKPTSNAPSKPQSKAGSQAPTKKVEVKQYVYSTVTDDDKIKEAFELFDSNDGRIDAGEVKDAMQNIGYDEKNPVIFQVVSELDTPRNKNSGGATFDDFCQTINYRIPEKETEEELRKIFELFLDPNSETTSLDSIKRVADEIGANIEEDELRAMLNKASKSGSELTFDDFVAIMKEKL
jgi:Ca2+-binding EF-hand superfamily protein